MDDRARVDESVQVRATPEEVWSVLGEPESAIAKLPALIRVTEREEGRWDVVLELAGKELRETVTVEELTPPHRIALALEGDLAGRYAMTLTAGAETTRIREQVLYRFSSPLLDLTLGNLAGVILRRLVRDHLSSLERTLQERRGRAAPPPPYEQGETGET